MVGREVIAVGGLQKGGDWFGTGGGICWLFSEVFAETPLWLMFCQEQAEQSTNSSLTLEQKPGDQAAPGRRQYCWSSDPPLFIIF